MDSTPESHNIQLRDEEFGSLICEDEVMLKLRFEEKIKKKNQIDEVNQIEEEFCWENVHLYDFLIIFLSKFGV